MVLLPHIQAASFDLGIKGKILSWKYPALIYLCKVLLLTFFSPRRCSSWRWSCWRNWNWQGNKTVHPMINLVSCCFLDEKLYFTEQFSLLTYSVSALLFCCKLDNFSNIKFKCIPRAVSKGWICHGCNDHDPGYFCREQTENRTKTTS